MSERLEVDLSSGFDSARSGENNEFVDEDGFADDDLLSPSELEAQGKI